VVGFNTGSRGKVPGKTCEKIAMMMMMMMIIIIIIIIINRVIITIHLHRDRKRIIGVSIANDKIVVKKEVDVLEYKALLIEIQRVWNVKETSIITGVTGSLLRI
jgi:hypothetical protein